MFRLPGDSSIKSDIIRNLHPFVYQIFSNDVGSPRITFDGRLAASRSQAMGVLMNPKPSGARNNPYLLLFVAESNSDDVIARFMNTGFCGSMQFGGVLF